MKVGIRRSMETFQRRKILLLILAVAFLVRFIRVNAPISGEHSWRQARHAMVARNLYRHGMNVFYPQVDWGGKEPLLIQSEFNIYAYQVALLYQLFGIHESAGRALSLAYSMGTLLFLFLISRRYCGENVAVWACAFYAVAASSIYYGRAIMPEQMMLFCSVAGLYYFGKWLDVKKTGWFLLASILVALACLIKITNLHLGLPLAFLIWARQRDERPPWQKLAFFVFLVMVPTFLWYFHSYQLHLKGAQPLIPWAPGGESRWGNLEELVTWRFYRKMIFDRLWKVHLTYTGGALFFIGLLMRRGNRQEQIFDIWLAAIAIYVVIVAKGNLFHEYYQLPFLLPASVFIGKACSRFFEGGFCMGGRLQRQAISIFFFLLITGVPVVCLARTLGYFRHEDALHVAVDLGTAIRQRTEPCALVVTFYGGNPTVLYYADRKGWLAYPRDLTVGFLERKRVEGASYAAGFMSPILPDFRSPAAQRGLDEVLRRYERVVQTEDYFLLDLRPGETCE